MSLLLQFARFLFQRPWILPGTWVHIRHWCTDTYVLDFYIHRRFSRQHKAKPVRRSSELLLLTKDFPKFSAIKCVILPSGQPVYSGSFPCNHLTKIQVSVAQCCLPQIYPVTYCNICFTFVEFALHVLFCQSILSYRQIMKHRWYSDVKHPLNFYGSKHSVLRLMWRSSF